MDVINSFGSFLYKYNKKLQISCLIFKKLKKHYKKEGIFL